MKPIEEIEKALEQSVMPAGKLSAVLVVAKTHAAELATLRARVGELERLLQDIQMDNEAAHGEGGGLWSPNGEFEQGIKAALAKGAK